MTVKYITVVVSILELQERNLYSWVMSNFEFPSERTCPECQGKITSAELKTEYDPVVVFQCPHCQSLLWKPGLEETGPIFKFDPDATEDSI